MVHTTCAISLIRLIARFRFIGIEIHVKVDVQLTHLTIIIGVALPGIGLCSLFRLLTVDMILERPVAVIIGLDVCMVPVVQLIVILYTETYRMIIADLPVGAEDVVQTIAVPIGTEPVILLQSHK